MTAKKTRSINVNIHIGEEEYSKSDVEYKEATLDIAFNTIKLLPNPKGIAIHIEVMYLHK